MRQNIKGKELEFYLGLHYPVTIHPDPEGGFVAEIEELQGCMTQAETAEEAFTAIEEARDLWIRTAYNEGQDIPIPRDMGEYTGKFLVRIPRTLHRMLVHAAKREGVSLNQYVTSLLSEGISGNLVKDRFYNVLNMASYTFLMDPSSKLWGSTGEVLNFWQLNAREKSQLVGKK